MLDTSGLSTTNTKMRHVHTVIGFVLLVFVLLVPGGQGDISLRSRQQQQQQQQRNRNHGYQQKRQTYLPPPIQAPYSNKQFLTVRKQALHSPPPNHGNTGVQVVRILSQQTPNSAQSSVGTKFGSQGYSPLQQQGQHANDIVTDADIINDDNFDVSLVSFGTFGHGGPNEIHITEHLPTSGPQLPAKPIALPTNFKNNFQNGHTSPSSATSHPGSTSYQSTHSNTAVTSQRPQGNGQFSTYKSSQVPLPLSRPAYHDGPAPQHSTQVSGQDYRQQSLKGNQYGTVASHNPFKGPEYLPPHQHTGSASSHSQAPSPIPVPNHTPNYNNFKGPGGFPQQSESHHYSPPTSSNSPFKGPDYLPPHHQNPASSQSAIPKHNQTPSYNPFKGPDYLPPHHNNPSPNHSPTPSYNEHLPLHHDNPSPNHSTAPNYNDHHGNSSPSDRPAPSQNPFKGPDYLPPQHDSPAPSHSHGPSQDSFSGSDYSPPHQHSPTPLHNPFKGPDYLPPNKEAKQHNSVHLSHTTFKAPELLPSFESANQQQQQGSSAPDPNTAANYNFFKGPDYLPPYHNTPTVSDSSAPSQSLTPTYSSAPSQSPLQSNNPYKGPDYLPPHQYSQNYNPSTPSGPDYQSSHEHYSSTLSHNPTLGQNFLKSPDYSAPHQTSQNTFMESHHQNTLVPSYNNFKGPDYLPPHEGGTHQHSRPPSSYSPFKGPDYLPPHSQPSNLPSGYDFMRPENAEQAIAELHTLPEQDTQQRHNRLSNTGSISNAIGPLPAGYDFIRPPNAEEAIAELHSLQTAEQQKTAQSPSVSSTTGFEENYGDVTVGTQLQVADGGIPGAETVYSPPTPSAEYLAPENAERAASNSNGQQDVIQYNQQQSFAQVQHSPSTVYRAPDYLPPQTSSSSSAGSGSQVTTQQFSQLHSLSSYMTTVQPFERYGNANFQQPARRPFQDYGPPTVNTIPHTSAHSHPTESAALLDIAPMYRENTALPKYYAPAMPYDTNSIAQAHYTEAYAQTTQGAQGAYATTGQISTKAAATSEAQTQFAPITTLRPFSTSARKIRTVQIVNPNTVKTLKVLESSDAAGVKTIKILGRSHENPIGEHQIIRVVSRDERSGGDSIVQTVKIYDDHEQGSNPQAQTGSNAIGPTNQYIPPTTHSAVRQTAQKAQQRR